MSMIISKEGRGVIPGVVIALGALAVVFTGLSMWALARVEWVEGWWIAAFWMSAALVTSGFVVWFFRVPSRELLADEDAVFAPCDGCVVIVKEIDEKEVTGERRRQVSIFMSITDVHQNWFPVGGRVTHFKHHNGHFHVAWHPKASAKNEHTTVGVETAHGVVVFRQIAGFVARRIVSYVRAGALAQQNTPCGFIKFGSRMDIFLPLDAEVSVVVGERVTGSQTVIARFGK